MPLRTPARPFRTTYRTASVAELHTLNQAEGRRGERAYRAAHEEHRCMAESREPFTEELERWIGHPDESVPGYLLEVHGRRIAGDPERVRALVHRAAESAREDELLWTRLLDELARCADLEQLESVRSTNRARLDNVRAWIRAQENPWELRPLLTHFRWPELARAVLTHGPFDVDSARWVMRTAPEHTPMLASNPWLPPPVVEHVAYMGFDWLANRNSDRLRRRSAEERAILRRRGIDTLVALQNVGYELPSRILEEISIRSLGPQLAACAARVFSAFTRLSDLSPDHLRALYRRHRGDVELAREMSSVPSLPDEIFEEIALEIENPEIIQHARTDLRLLRAMAWKHGSETFQHALTECERARHDPEIRTALEESPHLSILQALCRYATPAEAPSRVSALIARSHEAALEVLETLETPIPASVVLPLLTSWDAGIRNRAILVLGRPSLRAAPQHSA